MRWVGHAEELLGSPVPPSFVLDTVTAQIQEHKARAGGAGEAPSGPVHGAGVCPRARAWILRGSAPGCKKDGCPHSSGARVL